MSTAWTIQCADPADGDVAAECLSIAQAQQIAGISRAICEFADVWRTEDNVIELTEIRRDDRDEQARRKTYARTRRGRRS